MGHKLIPQPVCIVQLIIMTLATGAGMLNTFHKIFFMKK